jgi:hypothetical protein
MTTKKAFGLIYTLANYGAVTLGATCVIALGLTARLF